MVSSNRLFAHKTYEATRPLKYFLMIGFMISGQEGLYKWCLEHRMHHKYTDTDGDPYNAKRGLFFSHFGWLITVQHPVFIEKTRTIPMNDLENDKLIMLQEK